MSCAEVAPMSRNLRPKAVASQTSARGRQKNNKKHGGRLRHRPHQIPSRRSARSSPQPNSQGASRGQPPALPRAPRQASTCAGNGKVGEEALDGRKTFTQTHVDILHLDLPRAICAGEAPTQEEGPEPRQGAHQSHPTGKTTEQF